MSDHGPFCPAFTAPKVGRFPAVEATGPCNCKSSSGFDLKKVYYLSGPMAGYPDNNIPAFRKASEELTDAGILVISPHDLVPPQEDPTGVDYLANDFREMCEKCQGIILLRGWPQSQGARAELEIAMTLHWPVYYYENFTLTDMNRIPWIAKTPMSSTLSVQHF